MSRNTQRNNPDTETNHKNGERSQMTDSNKTEATTLTRRTALKGIGAGAAAIAGGSAIAMAASNGDSWPNHSYDNANTSHSPTSAPREGVTEKWTVKDVDVTTYPIVGANGTVYFGISKGRILAVDAETGKEQWRFQAKKPRFGDENRTVSTPTLAGDTLYFAEGVDGLQYALDAETGEERWHINRPNNDARISTVINNKIYTVFGDGVHAISAGNGKILWTYEHHGWGIRGSPAIVGDTIYLAAGTAEHRRFNTLALNRKDGTKRWEKNVGGGSIVAAANGLVYSANKPEHKKRRIHALDAETGERVWASEKGYNLGGAAVTENAVFTGINQKLVALDSESGSKIWESEVGYVDFQPVVADGTIIVSDINSEMHALDAESGNELWNYSMEVDFSEGSSAVVDGSIYTAGLSRWNDGTLHALEESS